MRIPRVYDNQPLKEGTEICLGDFAAQHLGRVLRMQIGDSLILFNGQGGEYTAVITSVTKKQLSVRVGQFQNAVADSALMIHLGQGLSRGERMDYAVQKATELGVQQLTPLFTERSEVRLKADRLHKRTQHWQQVAVSASEQSLRCTVPEIQSAEPLKDWISQVPGDLKLVLDPRSPHPLSSFEAPESVALLIGPEGGLSDDEVKLARGQGFLPISLGPRILRTETAPVVALSLLQYLWGDI
ncbi:16S rRNA (uracil(1498)-N(3))-methyltransferase [Motiliproteus sp. MSK22-1]|uniref:16S rRNA (uracil(1498)-N(3))-methyltransferase n=1 Tax=Motiliproteus sp. MSK22-1 TaxID=1897630 RepID=UPI00097840B3|nr:16S rRNA (uracil(1498)-N(3))-methyltransferase [Motiliproteus sp. MSK22-1]OMH39561.1 16S rRNA (uracil(1498)-N(3))-methyltransferase [Motiliproteus sp. MSK22-1]